MNLCLQSILAHGSAVGTATPKHPLFNQLHMWSGTERHSGADVVVTNQRVIMAKFLHCVRTVCILRATAHAGAGILTQEYLSPV